MSDISSNTISALSSTYLQAAKAENPRSTYIVMPDGSIIPMLLKRQQVEQLTSVGRSHLYAMMADDKFPRPVNLSGGRVAWLASEVHDWILARIAERDGSAAK